MEASMAAEKKAICVEFYYATAGNGTAPIDIYIEDGRIYSLMHHVDASTRGVWRSSRFSCCLPHVERAKRIAIRAKSTEDAIPAIDQMDIHMSDMPCDNDQLACYPTPPFQVPRDPQDSSPSCPKEDEKAGGLSCDFNSDAMGRPDICKWYMSSGWIARQKIDGSGRYDTLYSTLERNAVLLGTGSHMVGSVCIEIQFATANIIANLSNAFTISLQDRGGWVFYSEHAYSYDGSDLTVWKRNTFSTCLPQKQKWQVKIVSNMKGLQLDYIQVKTSQTPECKSTTIAATEASKPSTSPEYIISTSAQTTETARQTSEGFITVKKRQLGTMQGSTTMGTTRTMQGSTTMGTTETMQGSKTMGTTETMQGSKTMGTTETVQGSKTMGTTETMQGSTAMSKTEEIQDNTTIGTTPAIIIIVLLCLIILASLGAVAWECIEKYQERVSWQRL
ncbi:hypothetical protein ElyMa_005472000 [Elysia marginata]|uniref:MAM domain-containing protein n=1 Tax=Elysia marginata TaxID=1093978 RepID=A0AAV4ERD5_9GAST|nr:hypothetical protein ElyMa_005472000 [Elysia marginata]